MTGSFRSLAKKIPSYLLHKPSGQARVRIEGKDYYLGPFGSVESRKLYGDIIAKHANGQSVNRDDQPGGSLLTINELSLAFLIHADSHYVKDGVPTSEIHCMKAAIRPLVNLYGETTVDEFGPLALKAVRASMVAKKWARRSINRAVGRIRHIFKWGVGNELVSPATLQKLQAVDPLLAGRTEAHDNQERSAVSEEDINAVRAAVSELVKDLIDLQRLIGARSGELLSLSPGMINRKGAVWLAVLKTNKNIHHGKTRTLAIGPQAQLILVKYLTANQSQRMFRITREAYCRAITRACDKVGIDRWVPHQLRHTAAETVREQFGLEHAQAMLGHSTADMAEHYAKVGTRKAVEVALRIG